MIQGRIRSGLCMDGLLGRLGLPQNYLRIFQVVKLKISCDFQIMQKLAMSISSKGCTVHVHVFAYLGFWDGREVPGIIPYFSGIYFSRL